MKKMLMIGLVAMVAACAVAQDFPYKEVTVIVTNDQTAYSDQIAINGILEKIEVTKTGAGSNTVTVATWDGTTALDTMYVKALVGVTRSVARPRVIGTTTAAVDLAAVTATSGVGTNYSTFLTASYEKIRFGGNVKVQCVATDGISTNVVKIYLSK